MSAFAFILSSTAELNLHTWKRHFLVSGSAVKNHFHFSLRENETFHQRDKRLSDWVGTGFRWMPECPGSRGEQVIFGSQRRLLMLLVGHLSSLQLASCLWVFGYRVWGCQAVSVKTAWHCAHFCAWVHVLTGMQVLNEIGFNLLYRVTRLLLILLVLRFLRPRLQENEN